MNKLGLSLNQKTKIDKIRADYYAGKYNADCTEGMLIDDILKLKLKNDVLDAFGLSKKKKADAIWDAAWALRDDDTNQDVISVMCKLLPIL